MDGKMTNFICIVIGFCISFAGVQLFIKGKCKHRWSEWHEVGSMYDRYRSRACIKCEEIETKDF